MKKHLIPDFPSLVGKHCSSTAIRETTMYYKNPLSEAMIFGIGSGLFFSYFSFANNYPRLLITEHLILKIIFSIQLTIGLSGIVVKF